MKRIILGFISILFTVSTLAQTNTTPKYKDFSLDFETRTTDLVDRMTLEEKISQLGNDAPAIKRLGIDKYNWWNECLHGVGRAGIATVFPQAIGMAATFDTNMMLQVAEVISDEARAKHHEALRNNNHDIYYGLTFWSPNINIFRDPRWGRGHETYGEDPYLTGQMGMQFVKGLQGDDPKYLKLVATAKHFAVHNGPEPERHSFNAVTNTRDLWETYLPAFEDLMVKAKTHSIMGAYNRVDGESASASWMLLEDILRNKWNFEGYVVSDCGAIADIYKHHNIVETAEEAAAIGVRRGCDLNCGGVYQEALKNAVEKGLIDEGEIDLSVYRLMLSRMKLGMFDPAEIVPYASIPLEVNDSKAHDEMALKMAQKSMTLLKNNGILPLNKEEIKNIVVIGPNADNIEALRGNYYGDASNPVTVLEGIRKEVGESVNITYLKGVSMVKGRKLSRKTLRKVKDADAVIFVGGLDATWEGEEMSRNNDGFNGGDRTKIELPALQLKALNQIKETGTPLVFVLMSGSAVAFDGEEKEFDAMLMAWYPGQRGGEAVADVLFGNYNPAGRLPVTFYKSTKELADFKDYNMRAGKGFTYRYYNGEALYSFGHGLSYTKFDYSGLNIDKTTLNDNDEITVSITVKNSGDRDGEEVIQLYVKDITSDIWMAEKQLREFKRIELKKGEEKTIEFKLKVDEDFRYYNSLERSYMVEKGDFEIQLGSSSADIRMKKIVTVK